MRKASLIPIITQSKRTKNLFGPCVNPLTYSHGTLGITSTQKFHHQMWIMVHELRRWRTILSRDARDDVFNFDWNNLAYRKDASSSKLRGFIFTNLTGILIALIGLSSVGKWIIILGIIILWNRSRFMIQVSLMTNFSLQDKETTNKRYSLRPCRILCVILDSGLFESMNTCIENMPRILCHIVIIP